MFICNSSSRDSIYNNLIKKILNLLLLLKMQVICLKIKYYRCSCFLKLDSENFVIEEIDFPEKRLDMRINQKAPDLKTILKSVLLNKDFNTEYIDAEEKNYFLENYSSIEFFKGNINEMVIIRKK